MRMRTIREAHRELRQDDPRCSLGLAALYSIVESGAIPSVRTGKNRVLIDLDRLESYLSGETVGADAG